MMEKDKIIYIQNLNTDIDNLYNELLNNKQEVIEGKVSELAAKYNGGGHIYSSGARVKTKEELNNLIVDYDDLCKDYLKNN